MALEPYDLRVDHVSDPLGIDTAAPRFSWKLRGGGAGDSQSAYRLTVMTLPASGPPRAVWDSGPVQSDRSHLVSYEGPALRPRTAYRWTVAVSGQSGRWGAPARGRFETAMPASEPWRAAWIAGPAVQDTPGAPYPGLRPCLHLRRPFNTDGRPVRARLYATAAGVYRAFLNGRRVGADELSPGWTDYRTRIRYQTYDVTDLIRAGDNVLGFTLGDGWYAGYVGFGAHRAYYGDEPRLLAELHLWDDEGREDVVATDGAFTAGTGPMLYSDMLMGELYDGRREVPGWCLPGQDPAGWEGVRAADAPGGRLVADRTAGVGVFETRSVQAVTEPEPGVYILDFGQNLVGRIVMDTRGVEGPVRIRHGEVLDSDGRLYTENLRFARAVDEYRGGGGEPLYTPTFTVHGFRYVEVSGYGRRPGPGDIRAEVLAARLPAAGEWTSADPLLERLQHNIVWSQRGNLMAVPTDCPQRDERLGWLGDAQVFVETACWNQDVAAYFADWLDTVDDGQSREGAYPDVAPRLVDEADGAPGWADAGLIVPWTLYRMYGDRELLARHFPNMVRYVAYLERHNPDGLWLKRRANDFGDWLAVGAETPRDLIATAFYAEDARILARVSDVLGEEDARRRFEHLHDKVRAAFQARFLGPDGQVLGDTQTGYLLTLAFHLAPGDREHRVAKRLVHNLAQRQNLLTTGFLGIGHLLPVLSETGFDELAWSLIRETRFPSWGYEIRHGATTIWERWDGFTDERGFQTPEMNSFNHYAFGAVGAWMFRYAAGIRPLGPGFARVGVEPHVSRGAGGVRARFDSVRGPLESGWEIRKDRFELEVKTPDTVPAEIAVPWTEPEAVLVDSRRLTALDAAWEIRGGRIRVACGPGRHRLSWPAP